MNICTWIIKPDAHRECLEQVLLNEIENAGFKVICRKERTLTEQEAAIVYNPLLKKQRYYRLAVENLISGPSTVVLTKWSGRENACEVARQIKGKIREGGLRDKYTRYYREHLEAQGYRGKALLAKMAENKIHTTDDFETTLKIMSRVLNSWDLAELETREPKIASLIKLRQSIEGKVQSLEREASSM